MSDALESFSPPIRAWFRETFGEPTPPQAAGWPAIQRGDHTLILAPTGSGKTLAAFLWGIDEIFRNPQSAPGVHLLYISPLKALNNDIERNLAAPLAGIREVAARMGIDPPPLRVAVRTGDTPGAARVAMLKQPPHVLITTPESLYLLLTSPRAREMLRTVRTVIVDEIHTMVGEKRGVHLSLSLERLEHLAGGRIQRIGLSATVRPLEEAARFLGGQEPKDRRPETEDRGQENAHSPPYGRLPLPHSPTPPRPVTIIDTGYRKPLDIQVVTPVDDFRSLPGESVWPTVIPHVVGDIMRHRSTLIFCNNRRLAERTADRLNAQITAERSEEVEPGSTAVLAPGGIMRDRGMFAIGAEGPIRAHHGSMSKEARRQMEEDLKAGRLPALVGTSSLELGIDIGAVDLVVQLQSPKSVSQGLQRVGRSGHLVGQTSRGRIYATFREDLVEAAAVARGMLEGDVEPTATPRNPLDVLAQQIVAMVSVEEWSSSALFDCVRQAYAYGDLSRSSFDSVLEMLSGAYQRLGGPGHVSLRARIVWDRVNDRVAALPGTRMLALSNAGTIPDTGAYDVYLPDGKTKVGTLDEEFIFETRVGDVFLLGSNTWRVQEIDNDRIVVADAAGVVPRMPFWRGDYPWRPFELGARIGRLRREVAERLAKEGERPRAGAASDGEAGLSSSSSGFPSLVEWLRHDYALDERSAHHLLEYVRGQIEAIGAFSSDKMIVVESFVDSVGDPRMVVHSPFGGRVNGAWSLALGDALRERFGMDVETQVDDDGILIRLPQSGGAAPVDIVRNMTYAQARERILRELPQSALFGAHFRKNAGRALLLPKARGQKRTPFWLQRLKAKDLLATVLQYQDFPLVAETYRDCLADVLDMPHLQEVLDGIQAGRIEVVAVDTIVPSPVAAGLLFNLISVYMYEWDAPKAERQLQALAVRSDTLDDLLSGAQAAALTRPEAVARAVAQAAHSGPERAARTADELAVFLAELGDLSSAELLSRCAGEGADWLSQLAAQGRIVELPIPTAHGQEARWVLAELAAEYRETFDQGPGRPWGEGYSAHGAEGILRRFLRHAGPVTRSEILDRYAFEEEALDEALAGMVAGREVVQGYFNLSPQPALSAKEGGSVLQFCDRHLFEQFQRSTLAILRREVQPVPIAAYAHFLLGWQGLLGRQGGILGTGDHPGTPASTTVQVQVSSLQDAMELLRGAALPGMIWERDVLPGRVPGFHADDLAALCESGSWVWAMSGQDPRRADVRFFRRGEGRLFIGSPREAGLSEPAGRVLAFLRDEGASFMTDLQAGLGLKPANLRLALVELSLAELATNDALAALHGLLAHRGDAEGLRPLRSALEEELAERLAQHAERGPRRPTGVAARDRYHSARRRVAQRLHSQQDETDIDLWRGRWALLHRTGILGAAQSGAELALAQARVLLARYGLVTRETIAHEQGPWMWDALYEQLQRMELRGEVRRGYFVTGLSGVQFAMPDAVEALRAARNDVGGESGANESLVVMNATDPANIYGAAGMERAPVFARLPSTHLVLGRGWPVVVAEDSGERLTVAADAAPDEIRRALQSYLERPHAPRRQAISTWNDEPVLDSSGVSLLQALGFSRTPAGLERWV